MSSMINLIKAIALSGFAAKIRRFFFVKCFGLVVLYVSFSLSQAFPQSESYQKTLLHFRHGGGETGKWAGKDELSQDSLKVDLEGMGSSQTPGNSSYSTDHTDQYEDPNLVPYRSRKNPLGHALSFPATLWRVLWYPLGETTIWAEQNHIHQQVASFFLNDDLTGGFFPIVNVGGNMGFAAGLMAFHSNLFNQGKSVNFDFLFGSLDDNYTTLTYSDKTFLGSSAQFQLTGRFVSDSDENHFIGGNENTEDDETSYDIEEGKIQIAFGFNPSKAINGQIMTNVRHVDIAAGGGKGGDIFPTDIDGFGTAKLWTIGSSATLDLRKGWPRTLSGALVKFGYQFNTQISGDHYQYQLYFTELQHFLSIPLLAKNRRFSVRGRLEKLDTISDKEIPFYELRLLGDADNLRGFEQNRFRARGSLLFNIEYRYPIWDTWDAVVFLDEGQVFDRFQEVRLDRFNRSVGGGLRFMTRSGFLFRFEVGLSDEKTQVFLRLKPNF